MNKINKDSQVGWYVVAEDGELHQVVSVTDHLVTESGSFPLDSLVVWPDKVVATTEEVKSRGIDWRDVKQGSTVYVTITYEEGFKFMDIDDIMEGRKHAGWWLPENYLEL